MSDVTTLQNMLGKVSGSASTNPNQELSATEFNDYIQCLIDVIQNRVAVKVDSTGNGLVGVQDGSNLVFTVSEGSYIPGTIYGDISHNNFSNNNGIVESDPANGQFTIEIDDPSDAPVASDVIRVSYGYNY